MTDAVDIPEHPSPPGVPWRAFTHATPPFGYASYYLSDDLARWPVRGVTRVKDSKSDPNLETATYGLFSTCQMKMRSGIVANRPSYVFFITKHRGRPRQLTGMYELGWWAPGSFQHRSRDFALAADRMRFIEPVDLSALPAVPAEALLGRWRLSKILTSEQSSALAEYIHRRPDRTAAYLAEIDRLERINIYHSGYRYPTWGRDEPFSWDGAARYLRPAPHEPGQPEIPNVSPSGWWSCVGCGELIENGALLKSCRGCHELGTLRPMDVHELAKEA